MICDLCHREFSEAQCTTSCEGCLSKKRCHGIRCPYCLYEMVPEPHWLTRLFGFFEKNPQRGSAGEESSQPLTDFPKYRHGTVTHLSTQDRNQLKKLAVIGAFPGTDLVLTQKFPSLVIQMGFCRFSLDRELASCIYVKKQRIG